MTNISEYVTAALAVLFVIGIFVLMVLSIVVPPELWTAFGLIIGFFFGNKSGTASARAAAK